MGRRKKKYRDKKQQRDSRLSFALKRFIGSTTIGAGVLGVGSPIAYFMSGGTLSGVSAVVCGVSLSLGLILMKVGYRTGQTKDELESASPGLPKPDLEKLAKRTPNHDEYDLDPYRDKSRGKRRDDDSDDDDEDERRIRYRKRDYDRDRDDDDRQRDYSDRKKSKRRRRR